MKKYFLLIAAALTAVALVSCNKDDEENGGGGGESGPVVFETTDATTVCINEVNGGSGYKGIELYNPTDADIQLEGYFIIKNDDAENPYWTGAATDNIPAKGYLVIRANKETTEIDGLPATVLTINKGTGGLSGKKAVKLELKKGDTSYDVFDRGFTDNDKTEVALPDAGTNSFARQQDGKKTWKLMTQTIGATNVGAAVQGEVTVDPE